MLALRWEDVDFDAATLQVRRTLIRVGKEIFYGPCKAGSERTVPLTPMLAEALRAHRRRQVEERLRLGAGWVDERPVFTNQVGHRGGHRGTQTPIRFRCWGASRRGA